MGSDTTRYVDRPTARASGAPAARRGEGWARRPGSRQGVKYEWAGEGGEEVVGSAGEEYEVSGDGDGLDWEVEGEKGRVAEEEAEWWVG